MATKKPISISRHKISDQKWENHFPEEIFLEIWLITEDCKYNYTAEIKFEKVIRLRFYGENKFWTALKLLIYAN